MRTGMLRHSPTPVLAPIHPSKRITIVHIYKDFDIYNGLIEEFLVLTKLMDPGAYDVRVCVFNYKGSSFGRRFQQLGGRLDSLQCDWEDNPLIIGKLYAYLKRVKPDIVQTYVLKPNLYGRIAALLARVPVIISTEMTLKDQAHSVATRLRDIFLHPLNAILNRYTDVVLCSSDAIRRQWSTRALAPRMKVLHPYFDPAKLQNSSQASDKYLRHKHNWVIGTVGRLSEEKKQIDLLRAFHDVRKSFPEATLLVVGDGEMRSQLTQVARRLGISESVTFTGFQSNISEYLEKMDVFVLPSRTEGFGIVLLEAMTMGLPVIATDVGGIPEIIVNSEIGILVRPSRPDELSKAITELLSDPARMRAVALRGKAHVLSTFSAEQYIHERETVYKSALAAKADSGRAYIAATTRSSSEA